MTKRFWDWIDSRYIVRRVVLFITVWMTWEAFWWGTSFVYKTSLTSGTDIALVIAAVTVPITALQKFAFDTYTSGRGVDK